MFVPSSIIPHLIYIYQFDSLSYQATSKFLSCGEQRLGRLWGLTRMVHKLKPFWSDPKIILCTFFYWGTRAGQKMPKPTEKPVGKLPRDAGVGEDVRRIIAWA